jgi:hypothetical protein
MDDTHEKRSNDIDRRLFLNKISTAGAAALMAAHLSPNALAQTPSPSPSPSPTPAKPSPLAEAYAEVVKQRFGAHINAGQWDQIRRDVEGNVRTADRLRAYKLKNADEPDFIFFA